MYAAFVKETFPYETRIGPMASPKTTNEAFSFIVAQSDSGNYVLWE